MIVSTFGSVMALTIFIMTKGFYIDIYYISFFSVFMFSIFTGIIVYFINKSFQ